MNHKVCKKSSHIILINQQLIKNTKFNFRNTSFLMKFIFSYQCNKNKSIINNIFQFFGSLKISQEKSKNNKKINKKLTWRQNEDSSNASRLE